MLKKVSEFLLKCLGKLALSTMVIGLCFLVAVVFSMIGASIESLGHTIEHAAQQFEVGTH